MLQKHKLVLILVIFLLGVLSGMILNRTRRSIPKVIHKVYLDRTRTFNIREQPRAVLTAHASWMQMNPEYTVEYYDLRKCEAYLKKHYGIKHLKTFRTIQAYACKCDFFRYCLLYREGGVYTDWKMQCLTPLREVIKEDTQWVSAWDYMGGPHLVGNMSNGFFACVPNHPVLRRAIEIVVQNVEKKHYGRTSLDITGPGVLGRAFVEEYATWSSNPKLGVVIGDFTIVQSGEIYVLFNKRRFIRVKAPGTSADQNWKHGNNYNHFYVNRTMYSEKTLAKE